MAAQIMGILNVTPDSFSDGGRFVDVDAAVRHGLAMVEQGAHIVDVGGESTRPGAQPVSPSEEILRTEAVVGALADAGTRVSIDTRHEPVARAAVAAGAHIVNDVSASLGDVAAELGVPWIAMHMAGRPIDMQADPSYDDVVAEVVDYLCVRADRALDAGVPEVWIDPGIGFGKTVDHNLALLANLDRLVDSGHPVVVGVSRKSLLGVLTARSDAGSVSGGSADPAAIDDRLPAGVALGVWSVLAGASMLRVHDVDVHTRALQMLEVLGPPPPPPLPRGDGRPQRSI